MGVAWGAERAEAEEGEGRADGGLRDKWCPVASCEEPGGPDSIGIDIAFAQAISKSTVLLDKRHGGGAHAGYASIDSKTLHRFVRHTCIHLARLLYTFASQKDRFKERVKKNLGIEYTATLAF